jgi:5'-3' exonuclease
MKESLLLDAPSLVYRAFFALPKTLTDPSGRSVNAVRGYLDFVTRLLIDRRPERLVSVFDAEWRPQFRVDAYPGYKAQRPEDPIELPGQFDLIASILDAAGLVRVEAPGYEADDALATLAQDIKEGERAVIVSGDRDMLALVKDPHVALVFPVTGMRNLTEFDEAAVEEKTGVPPQLYAEFAMLRGDPSDGLPGVAGIGPVRAAKLLKEYGSIAGILNNVGALPPKQADAFRGSVDYLTQMREVVPLVIDATLDGTEPHEPEYAELERLTEDHNLGSSGTRLIQVLKGER